MNDPELADYFATRGMEAMQEGDYRSAEHYLMKAIDEDSHCFLAYNNLSALYELFGLYDKAVQAAFQALELKPDSAVVLYNVGSMLMRVEKYEQAASYLKQAVLRDPQYSLAVFNLAICYDLSGQLDGALLWYQRAAELDPSDPDPIYNVAEIHLRLKAYVSAERLCREALEKFDALFDSTRTMPYAPPGGPPTKDQFFADVVYRKAFALHLMSVIQVNQGKLQEALATVTSAIQLHPEEASWHVLMGQIYSRLGNHKEAEAAFAHARQLDPGMLAR